MSRDLDLVMTSHHNARPDLGERRCCEAAVTENGNKQSRDDVIMSCFTSS